MDDYTVIAILIFTVRVVLILVVFWLVWWLTSKLMEIFFIRLKWAIVEAITETKRK